MQSAVTALGLEMFTESDLASIIDQVFEANKEQVDKLGKNAFGVLMGASINNAGKSQPRTCC